MPLQKQLLPIQIGAGIDTKTDDKKVLSTKLLTLENGIFTQPGRINKRNGYQVQTLAIEDGGTITSPQGIKVLGDELVCAGTAVGSANDGKRLFAFSPTLGRWVDKGKYIPCKVTNKPLSADSPSTICSGANFGNYVLSAWASVTTGLHTRTVSYTIYDLSSETFLIPETQIATNVVGSQIFSDFNTNVWVSALGTNLFGIFYVNGTSEALVVRIVTISGGAVSIGSEQTVLASVGSGQFNEGAFFVIPRAVGAAVLVTGTNLNVNLILIDNSGAVTSSVVVGTTSILQAHLSLNFDGTNFWVYWFKSSNWHYAVYSAALSPVLTDTTGNAMSFIDNIAGVSTSGTTQTVYYSRLDTVRNKRYCLFTSTVNITGTVGTAVPIMSNMGISGAPVTLGAKTYLVLANLDVPPDDGLSQPGISVFNPVQPTGFIMDTSDNSIVAKFLAGQAGNYNSILASFSESSTKMGIVYPFYPSEQELLVKARAVTLVEFDFSDPDLYQSIEVNNQLVWNGGQVYQYDRQPIVELGFHLFPEIETITSGSSGTIDDGTYGYFAVYRWFDTEGNIHQSAPSPERSIVISGGGGSASVSLEITFLGATLKQNVRGNVQIGIFRTLADGTVAHLSNPDNGGAFFNIPNSPTPYITIVDVNPDSDIADKEILYTTGGVVDNIGPPPTVLMVNYSNRLWLIDSTNTNTAWYCKSISPGIGLSFSDLLIANIDPRQGDVTALASFDDRIVFFKKTVPFFSTGDGANDLGQNSTLSLPLIVASDVGCATPKSIIQDMPLGIMFKSDKGIYLMDRSLQIQYIGREVEAFNAQTITSAKLMDTKSQIRFLCSDGVELVYDYIYNHWSTFTNHLGLAADIWQGNYTYVRSDGDIYKETPGVFLDNTVAISLKIGTAWIKLTEIQNYERIKRLFVVGDYKSPHFLNGKLFFDYEADETAAAAFQFIPQAVLNIGTTDDVYQFRYHLERQKCESVRFVIADDFTGLTPGEGYSLSQFSIEAGLKQGGVKLSSYKSVG